jgi:hypothetical protein
MPAPDRRSPPLLDRREALADLDHLAAAIVERHSYHGLTAAAFDQALDAARARLPEQLSLSDMAVELMRVLASLGDGHTRLAAGPDGFLPRAYAPLLFVPTADGVIAVHPDRRSFLDERHRRVIAMDGRPIEDWLAAAAEVTPAQTPQFLAWHQARLLRYTGFLRRRLALPAAGPVNIELEGGVHHQADLVADKPLYGAWPRRTSGRLPDEVGYLRLDQMQRLDAPDRLASLRQMLWSLRDTRALVIDLRGNGGGSRDLLVHLLPYLMRDGEPPAVVNVAAYRLRRGESDDAPQGYLADRRLHPLASAVWTPEERAAIDELAGHWKPRWTPTPGQFSAWHYMVVSRPPETPFRYQGPVGVLLDAGSFSATEILLAALKGRPGVTLFGTPSAGGSGRPMGFSLRCSRLRIQASTMLSFDRHGELIQGRGVAPDRFVVATAEDSIGRGDSVLEHARGWLLREGARD